MTDAIVNDQYWITIPDRGLCLIKLDHFYKWTQISIMKTLIRCQELKCYFTAFCLLLGSIMPIDAQTIRQIEVSFPILKGKMKLQGVISQVAEAPQQSPILVLVTPPQAFNRDYVGFFKTLSDSLNSRGVYNVQI